MHSSEHAGDELVNTITFRYERNQSRDSALVVADAAEVGEDQLLERVDLVLQSHEVGNRLVSLVGVVDSLETDILLIFECAVEFGMLLVERELREQVVDVFLDQGPVSSHALARHAAIQAVNPPPVCHCLPQRDRVALLKNFVNCDQGFEGLHLVGEDRLDLEPSPEGLGGLVVPCVNDAAPNMLALRGRFFGARRFFDVDGQLGLGPARRRRLVMAMLRDACFARYGWMDGILNAL